MRSPVRIARAGPSSSASTGGRRRPVSPSSTSGSNRDGRVERVEDGARRRRRRRRRPAPRAAARRGSARRRDDAVGRQVAAADVLGERGRDDAVDRLVRSAPSLEPRLVRRGARTTCSPRSAASSVGKSARKWHAAALASARARSRRRGAASRLSEREQPLEPGGAADQRPRRARARCRSSASTARLPARRVRAAATRLGSAARRGAASAARRPKTRHSSSEFEARRFAPWTPVQAHSPAAYRPGERRCGRRGR